MYKELLDLIVLLLCDISSRFVIKDIKHHDARNTISSMVTIVRYFVVTQTSTTDIKSEELLQCSRERTDETRVRLKGERVSRLVRVQVCRCLMIRYSFSGLLSLSLYLSAPFFSSTTTVDSRFIERIHRKRERERKRMNTLYFMSLFFQRLRLQPRNFCF